jgi:hypothetical protein
MVRSGFWEVVVTVGATGEWWLRHRMVGEDLGRMVGEGLRVFELCLSPVSTGRDFFSHRSTLVLPVVTGESHFGREWLSPVPTGGPEFPGIFQGFSLPVVTG